MKLWKKTITMLPCLIRNLMLNRHVDSGRFLGIRAKNPFAKIIIRKEKGAHFILNGTLTINSFMGGREPVYIFLKKESFLIIDGDLTIGNGTQIFLEPEAHLYIGGRRKESAAGITEKSRIMVNQKVHIGADCLIAWGVYITDCDWHAIHESRFQSDVHIGDHVWISSNASILKGTHVGENSIIASGAVLAGKDYPAGALIGGIPGKIIRKNVNWTRDLNEKAS